MEEVLDRIIILIFFLIITLVMMLLYKYVHPLLYPQSSKQYLRPLQIEKSISDNIHYFGRLIGVSIIFLAYEITPSANMLVDFLHVMIWGTITFSLYLMSLYIMESILLYDFDYKTEILKRDNISYALVSFSIAISVALIERKMIIESESSLIILFILWLLTMVLFGTFSKLFKFYSSYNILEEIHHKNIGAPLIFSIFLICIAMIITTSLQQSHLDIHSYILRVILKVLLSLTILPLIHSAIPFIFPTKDPTKSSKDETERQSQHATEMGAAIYRSGLLLVSTLITILVVFRINFDSFI